VAEPPRACTGFLIRATNVRASLDGWHHARVTVQPGPPAVRQRGDLCPGVYRPWSADDGALVRLRLVGGAISADALQRLGEVSREYGDGDVHLTARANLQVRGLPDPLGAEVEEALASTGLLPHPTHELVRNIMVSPLSGLAGGRVDLRPVAAALDAGLCAHQSLAKLPGRFLFVLDDGRGDLLDRTLDLGCVAVSADEVQLRLGSRAWGAVVPLAEAAPRLVGLARAFLSVRGEGPTAPWHVDELPATPEAVERDPRTVVHAAPLGAGPGAPGVTHVVVPDGLLTPAHLAELPSEGSLVVTPWHGLLVPSGTT
jgi:precorrin-3B synthase